MYTVNDYFISKNIDVSFNTIGSTNLLVNLFIKETESVVQDSYSKNSQHVKHACYNKYYKIEPRTKFTGFEKFQNLDKEVRAKMSTNVRGLLGAPTSEITKNEYEEGSYLNELQKSFSNFKNPLLYLSGGIDSEFVALAMLDAGIQFIPVIFQWTNDSEQLLNIHDIYYALDFCESNNLSPIIRTINIDKLWQNPEFQSLAHLTNISSPQINTYVYMVELMAEEFPNSTHVLGGEIRFTSLTTNENNQATNYVTAVKTSPTAYNGSTYTLSQSVNYTSANAAASSISLHYCFTYSGSGQIPSQSWVICGCANGTTATVTGGTTSGNWFNASGTGGGTGFAYRISTGAGYGSYIALPCSAGGILTQIFCGTHTATKDCDSSTSYNLCVQVKSCSTGTVVTNTLSMSVNYIYNPALNFVATPGTGSWSRPNTNITTAMAAMYGGGGGGGGAKRCTGSPGEYNGAAGGGGAGAGGDISASFDASIPVTTYCVGSGGSGGIGWNNGSAGNNSCFVWNSVTFNYFGGGGGCRHPNTSSLAGGNGGSVDIYSGGTGAPGDVVENSYGGGGASWCYNGSNATNLTPGAGGPPRALTLSKANASGTITIDYGGGGDGGNSSLGTLNGCNATINVYSYAGSGGGGASWLEMNFGCAASCGGNGAPGRFYIYY